jgi:6-pyruvoyl-tetrahydropterin synthase
MAEPARNTDPEDSSRSRPDLRSVEGGGETTPRESGHLSPVSKPENSVYDPNDEQANIRPNLRAMEGGGETSERKSGHLHDASDESGGVGPRDMGRHNQGGKAKRVSSKELASSEENAPGGNFGFRKESGGKLGKLKGKLGKKSTKVKLAAGAAGGTGGLVLLVLFMMFIGSLVIPNFVQDVIGYQSNRMVREALHSKARVTKEKMALESSPKGVFQKAKAKYHDTKGKVKEKFWNKFGKWSPQKVMDNLHTNGKLNYIYSKPKGKHGRQVLKAIELDGKQIPVSTADWGTLDKIAHPAKYGKALIKAAHGRHIAINSLSADIREGLRGHNWLVRSLVAKQIRKEAGMVMYFFNAKDKKKYAKSTEKEADALATKEAEKYATGDGQVLKTAEERAKGSTEEIQDATDQAGKAELKCFKSLKCVKKLHANQGISKGLVEAITSIKHGFLKKAAEKLSGIYALAMPICMIYEGSIKKSGPSIDTHSKETMRSWGAVAGGADQLKKGSPYITGREAGALSRKLGDTSKSNAYLRASGLTVNTTKTAGPQASASGTYKSADIFNTFLPGVVGNVASKIAGGACPVVTNLKFAGAMIGLQIAAFFTGGGEIADAGLQTGKKLVSKTALKAIGKKIGEKVLEKGGKRTVVGSFFSKGMSKAIGKGFSKQLAKGAAQIGATLAATLIARELVASYAGAQYNGAVRGVAYANQIDAGANLWYQEMERRGNFGVPLTPKQHAQVAVLDSAFHAKEMQSQSRYQRYFAVANPGSLFNNMAVSLHHNLNLSSISSYLASAVEALNPAKLFAKFGSILQVRSKVFAASNQDIQDYNNVQWGWPVKQEQLYENSPKYAPFTNANKLQQSGKADKIAKKYGICYTKSMGTLLSGHGLKKEKPAIYREENGKINPKKGTCSPKALGPHNKKYGDLVFRWRICERDMAMVSENIHEQTVSARPGASSINNVCGKLPSSSKGNNARASANANTSSGPTAAAANNWGTPTASFSDEFNGSKLNKKWFPFGGRGSCSEGYNGHGRRCGNHVKVANGIATIEGTPDGVVSGIESYKTIRYGKIEIRERAYCADHCSNKPYHAVPLLFPDPTVDKDKGEIDYAERDVGAADTHIYIHGNGGGNAGYSKKKIDSTKWHNYAVDWEPNGVTWYIDGKKIYHKSISLHTTDEVNAGQMDMFPPSGTPMQHDYEQVDWIHYYKPSLQGT